MGCGFAGIGARARARQLTAMTVNMRLQCALEQVFDAAIAGRQQPKQGTPNCNETEGGPTLWSLHNQGNNYTLLPPVHLSSPPTDSPFPISSSQTAPGPAVPGRRPSRPRFGRWGDCTKPAAVRFRHPEAASFHVTPTDTSPQAERLVPKKNPLFGCRWSRYGNDPRNFPRRSKTPSTETQHQPASQSGSEQTETWFLRFVFC